MHSDVCLSLSDKSDLGTEIGDPVASENYYTTRNTHTHVVRMRSRLEER